MKTSSLSNSVRSELFDLVKSLSKSDKRFFRVFSEATGGKGEKSYLELFDRLEEMEDFDEHRLKEAVADKAFAKHLSTTKNRLFEQILRSQRVLRAGRSIDSRLRNLLEDIEVLYQRGLYKACEKRLRKGLALALSFEKEGIVMEFHDWQWRLQQRSGIREQSQAIALQLSNQEAAMQRLTLQSDLRHLYERIRIVARLQPLARTAGERSKYDEIINHPLLKSPPSDELFLCFSYYSLIQGIYHIGTGQFQQASDIFRKLMTRWEQSQDFIPEYAELYLQANHNYLNALLLRGKDLAEFIEAIHKLRSLTNLPRTAAVNFQWVSYSQELMYSMNLNPKSETVALIAKIAHWIDKNEGLLSATRRLSFFYNFAVYFFITGDWSESNRWVNHILNQREGSERQDIRDFARVFQLFLQYELGNFDLNEYLVRSAYRYMTRNKRYHDFERAIIELIKSSGQAKDSGESRQAIEAFQGDLLGLRVKYEAKAILGLQELILWTNTKLEGSTMGEMFEKLLQSNRPS